MRSLWTLFALVACLTLAASTPGTAAPIREEHVTGGDLDLVWVPGFGVAENLEPRTLAPGDPGYDNPSADHTVGVLTNAEPDSGGIAVSCTEPAGLSDYAWEAEIFTGDGNTRRGIVVRADPAPGFASSYQLVIESGLLQIKFRRLVNGVPTTLRTWFTTELPGGLPATQTWHRMGIVASGANLRCFWDGFELTSDGPIVDASLAAGWVGVYNFRFDIGGIPFLVDDLVLSTLDATPVQAVSWGQVKASFAGR